MKIFNKLIRDKIPEIIKQDNKIPNIRILSNEEYKLELLKKLIEESSEVLEAKDNRDDLIKELSDLLEVIDAVIEVNNLDSSEIMTVKDKRKAERGGFVKHLFLESVE